MDYNKARDFTYKKKKLTKPFGVNYPAIDELIDCIANNVLLLLIFCFVSKKAKSKSKSKIIKTICFATIVILKKMIQNGIDAY